MWRQIPNAISAARLLAAPVLLGAAVLGGRGLFTWLLLACLLSDILDGLIARAFHLRSRLGALLDSTADMIVLLIAAAGVFVFERAFLKAHGGMVAALGALYLGEAALAVLRYGRISSFHTVLARVAAYAQGIFVMVLFLWGYQGWIFYSMTALTAAALAEEMALLYLLPQWKSDVRGIYWVTAAVRRTGGSESHAA